MQNQELMLELFLVLGVVLVTGLIAIPVMEEADAKCVLFKNNGDPCKDKKPKKN
jgi:hypothetical protein